MGIIHQYLSLLYTPFLDVGLRRQQGPASDGRPELVSGIYGVAFLSPRVWHIGVLHY